MLQARLLGKYEIRMDGQSILIPSRPAQSFFAYLLLHPNTPHRREKLAGQFWPQAAESNARSNLRHSLWQIRKAIGAGANDRIEGNDLCITFHPQPGDLLDVDALMSCSDTSATGDLLQTISAYGGELLPGFYDDWVLLERERLQAVFERMISRLLDRLLAEERWDQVLEWSEQWIALGSTPEPAYRAIMLAQARLGNLAAAASQYQRCVEALSRELDVEPSDVTQRVFEQIRNGQVGLTQQESARQSPSTPIPPSFLDAPERPAPVFVGRETELDSLDIYLKKALEGHLQVVFVCGEAGSGKTALLQQFVHRSLAAHPDLALGWGVCNAFFGQGVPYLPFHDALDMLAGEIEQPYINGLISRNQAINLLVCFPSVVQALMEQGPGIVCNFLSSASLSKRLETILPCEQILKQQIGDLDRAYPANVKQEQDQLLEEYTRVLRAISSRHPLLILLDDLQWMDPGTGRLFFHLVRRLQNAPLLIAGAFRQEEVALGRSGERHPLEPLLNEFQTSFGKILIDLDRARETSGRDFVDGYLDTEPNHLDETFRGELYRRTLGHPLFTIQLIRHLQERGEILPDEEKYWIASSQLNWGKFPPEVEGIIGERIGRLDKKLQDLLLVAGVEGEQFTVQVLERVQETSERTILHQLSHELEKRHHLVQELGDTIIGSRRLVRFRFTHTLIQQYLYNQLGAGERAALHREIAETLEYFYQDEISAIAAPLARHYSQAGIREKAVEYLLQAGDQARSLYAHQEAIEHYRQALAFLHEMGEIEQTARTLMKLYLVYHSSFDFHHAQQTLKEYNDLWQRPTWRNHEQVFPPAQNPYCLPFLKMPALDPGLCETIFDLEWIKELYCGLVEWTEDRNVIPLASENWEVLENGRIYIFHLRRDMVWSDGERVTAGDFEYAWKRVLDPATGALSANLLYDIRGAKDFHQGNNQEMIGVTAPDPFTLVVELEDPCSYFPYILGDPISFAVPKHAVEREGNAWAEPGRIVTNSAFVVEPRDKKSEKTIHFTRNPRYFGSFKGNIEHVALSLYKNELDMYNAFIRGELDRVEFLIPQMQQDELKHYREMGQLYVSPVPFVDAIYFITDRPPFDNPDLRRAFVLATDREKLAHEIEHQLPATGGYIPPGLPGHSPNIGLPYDPHQARRILAEAGYPQGKDFPPVGLLLGLVGLEKGDNLIFSLLHDMWKENLGVTIRKCWDESSSMDFKGRQDYHLFFIGWLADFPDPASFLQSNYSIEKTHWQNPRFDALVAAGRRTLDQNRRMDLYRQADRILIEEAVIQPLFYGNIFELRQPWVRRLSGSSIYSSQWKNITLMPH